MHTSLGCGKLMALMEANLSQLIRWCLVFNACLCLSKGWEVSNLSLSKKYDKHDKRMARPIPVTHHLPTDLHMIDMTDLVSTISLFLKHLEHRAKNDVKIFWHMPPPSLPSWLVDHWQRNVCQQSSPRSPKAGPLHLLKTLIVTSFKLRKSLDWWKKPWEIWKKVVSNWRTRSIQGCGLIPSRRSTSPNTHNFPFPSSWTKKDPNCERKVMALNWFGFQMRTASADLYLFLIFLLEP